MGSLEQARIGWRMMADAWRHRRTEEGGMADETAFMGMLIIGAIAVAGAVGTILIDKIGDFGFGWGD